MTGRVFKKGTGKAVRWLVIVDHGYQPSRRCSGCQGTVWTAETGDRRCDSCGAALNAPVVRRHRTGHGSFKREAEAKEHLTEVLGRSLAGTYVAPKRQTFADFIEGEWLPSLHDLRPSTRESYARNLRVHVLPRIGSVQLQEIDPAQLDRLYMDLLATGRRGHRQGEGLSPRTVRYIATTIHKALADAASRNRVARNAADYAKAPRVPKHEWTPWTGEQLAVFLQWVAGDNYGPPFYFLATTGMRRGEMLGLRWDDVDLDAGRVSVRRSRIMVGHRAQDGETKTAKTRVVELDAGTVAVLRQQRARQAQIRLRNGSGPGTSGSVFTHEDGHPYHPERFSREFDRKIERYNRAHPGDELPRIRLHDLRHTWATLALQAGEHPKVVSDRLGHSTTAVTMEIYSHVTRSMRSGAAERVAALIFGA